MITLRTLQIVAVQTCMLVNIMLAAVIVIAYYFVAVLTLLEFFLALFADEVLLATEASEERTLVTAVDVVAVKALEIFFFQLLGHAARAHKRLVLGAIIHVGSQDVQVPLEDGLVFLGRAHLARGGV